MAARVRATTRTKQRARRALGVWALALGLALWGVGAAVWTAPSAAQARDPFLGWHTLETEHFVIHYHDGLGSLPERVAVLCEEAHAALAPALEWTPRERTQVILDDTIDVSNGFAVIVPRNTIRLFLYGPEQRSNLGDYDDWLRLLVFHEYVHILHIDTIGGVPEGINTVLGKTTAPNQLMPRWYTEGLATYYESTRTGGGRVRSALFEMYLRTAFLSDRLLDLGQLSGSALQWPRGNNIYLYGSHFLDYLAQTRGEKAFNAVHRAYGRRLIPYAINTTVREVVGKDFDELYGEWKAHLGGKYRAQDLVTRLKAPTTPLEWLTTEGYSAERPRVRHGRRQVTWYGATMTDTVGLYAHDLKTGRVGRTDVLNPDAGGATHDWDPTGRFVVFHGNRLWRNAYSYNDLYLKDVQTDRVRRLTEGGRARDPAFGPKGEQVAFVVNRAGSTSLALYDLRRDTTRLLVTPGDKMGQMDTPVFSPDGRFIAFSYWRQGAFRDVYLYDLRRHTLAEVTHDRALDLGPSFSPDGRYLLFASDRTGIYNIYAADMPKLAAQMDALDAPPRVPASKRAPWNTQRKAPATLKAQVHQVTSVRTGAFAPQVVHDPSGDWLYLVGYNVEGFNLARTPWRPEAFSKRAAPPSRPPMPVPIPDVGDAKDLITARGDYAPLRYMAPLSVYPLLGFNNAGRDSYGVELVGSDPVGLHTWSLNAEYFSETDSVFVVGGYTYGRFPVLIGVGGQYSRYERAQGLIDASSFLPFKEEAYDGQLNMTLPVFDGYLNHFVTLAYNLRFTQFYDKPNVPDEPGDIQPADPSHGNFSSLLLTWGLSDGESYGRSIATEEGYDASLTMRVRDRFTGADVRSMELRYNLAGYIPNPWLDNHTLGLRANGGIGRSNFLRRELFSAGGIPVQEVFTSILNEAPLGGVFLRGFDPFAFQGEQVHVLTASYRLPLWRPDTGPGTLPIFAGPLSLAVFSDWGSAFNGPLADADFRLGSGAELRLAATLGYALPASFRLGYAHGFGAFGTDNVYFFFGSIF